MRCIRSPLGGFRSPFGQRRDNALFAVSIGSGNVASGTELTATITPDPSPATPTYQWTDDGVNITGATSATYTPTIDTDSVTAGSLIRCVVTIDSEPYTSNARAVEVVDSLEGVGGGIQINSLAALGADLTAEAGDEAIIITEAA